MKRPSPCTAAKPVNLKPAQELFTTARLRHRVGHPDDLDPLVAIKGDDRVMAQVGNGRGMPRGKVRGRLHGDINWFAAHGAAHGIIESRETGVIVGYGGVGRYDRDRPDHLELGYLFQEACWGQGLGSEFVQGAIDYSFTTLGATLVHACAMPQNKASCRIMEKSGMVFEGYYPETDRNVYQLARPVS
ncbi:MAG: GNAT family N-acetyltransferase [Candidatus Latescibacteria bacterium]|nr:GNAT family N-acetyltransferase [Candidatus Latescibacterota bacterium]